nr:restriction endonuclease subunit S [Apilactobacillus kunkeei]
MVSFTNERNCNLKWINYYMMNSDWLRRTTVLIGGTGQKEYSVKTLKSLKIKVPSLKEQQKIGEFLSKLDKMINHQSDKIDELKRQKKAFLQKMFI